MARTAHNETAAAGARAGRHGRPRSKAVDRAIERAAEKLLLAAGFSGMSMVAVAAEAKVSTATLYRRWPSKNALALHVLGRVYEQLPIVDTGDLRRDLSAFFGLMLAAANHPLVDRTLPSLLGAAGEGIAFFTAVRTAIIEPRRDAVAAIVRGAIARGELRHDADAVVDALIGYFYYRHWVLRQPVTAADGERVIDLLLAGAEAAGRAR